eukprot:TRINITY_DN6640_c0_g1_i1.p1 TRINITY_DN6640_c0_g1~~TRINITY_DN6640_c0_g1_i1.p1  ORF type:complete len:193 (-),score=50.36 TRINITY_DN6640_c0_g1_i1:436-1014(-)
MCIRDRYQRRVRDLKSDMATMEAAGPNSSPAQALVDAGGYDRLMEWVHLIEQNNIEIERLSLLHTETPEFRSDADLWNVDQVVQLVHTLDKRTNLDPALWQEIAVATGRDEASCKKFAMEYLLKLSARNGLGTKWSRNDEMLFEEGLIKYGAEPELWQKVHLLLPDKSINMLKERYKWMWRLCHALPPIASS